MKSAYLEMFAVFGYGFLCDNPNAAKIRKQILHPEEDLVPYHASIIDRDFPDNVVGVNVVIEPLDRLSFMVVLPLRVTQNKFSKKMGVLIPGPDEEAWGTYNNFLKEEKRNLKLINFNDLSCVKDKTQALRFHEIWHQAKYSLL